MEPEVSIVVHGLLHTICCRAQEIKLSDLTDLHISNFGFASRAFTNHCVSVFLSWVKAGALHHFERRGKVESGQEKWASGLNMITLYISGHHNPGTSM